MVADRRWIQAACIAMTGLFAIPLCVSPERPLLFFGNNAWVFCFSYLVQPAFCIEVLRCSVTDAFGIGVLIANSGCWLCAVLNPLLVKREQWETTVIANFVLGLFVNTLSYAFTLMRLV
jgi:hypothetical protein